MTSYGFDRNNGMSMYQDMKMAKTNYYSSNRAGYNLNELYYLNPDKTKAKLIRMKYEYKKNCYDQKKLNKQYRKVSKIEQVDLNTFNNTIVSKGRNLSKHINNHLINELYSDNYRYENRTFLPCYWERSQSNSYEQLKKETIDLLQEINYHKRNTIHLSKDCSLSGTIQSRNREVIYHQKTTSYKKKYEDLSFELIKAKEMIKKMESMIVPDITLNLEEINKLLYHIIELKEKNQLLENKCHQYLNKIEELHLKEQTTNQDQGYQSIQNNESNIINEAMQISHQYLKNQPQVQDQTNVQFSSYFENDKESPTIAIIESTNQEKI